MDSKTLLAIVSVICLTILGSVIAYTQPEASRTLDSIIAAISAAGGIGIYLIGQKIRSRIGRR